MGTFAVYSGLVVLLVLALGLLLGKAGQGQEMIDQVNRDINETS